jgi:hypothetical protein
MVAQDTRVTRYLIAGGSEVIFQLPLPFCPGCLKSARRRPGGVFHKLLVFIVTSFACALGLLMSDDALGHSTFIVEHVVAISAVVALTITALIFGLRRPSGNQTSYYQPVRITKLRQTFLAGRIQGIRFAFTNPLYASEFSRLNAVAIQQRLLEVAPP